MTARDGMGGSELRLDPRQVAVLRSVIRSHIESGEPVGIAMSLVILTCGFRLTTVTIIPAASDNPQGSPAIRGIGLILIRLTASTIRNVKPACNLCPSKAVSIMAIISSFSCARALLSLILMAVGDVPIALAISSLVMPPK